MACHVHDKFMQTKLSHYGQISFAQFVTARTCERDGTILICHFTTTFCVTDLPVMTSVTTRLKDSTASL